jgi:CBS domain containing-hemolysin-like protein
MPKIIAKKNANRLALGFAYAVRALMILLKPVVLAVVGLTRLITLPMRGEKQDESGADEAVEELQSIIETAEDEAVLDEDRSELLQAALDFSEISASEAMTARVDMVAIDVDDSMEDILELIDKTPFSRCPSIRTASTISSDFYISTISLRRSWTAASRISARF